ncbi:MAG: 2-oxo acid dehydrogenase subunit E2 [Candidatus Heimdallarchaeota archaeon]|nr:2-oxo acid dehydrogenase subunit E2 [Candidatus Heimdallarchaeota archaeon]MCK4253545.1 2-oxo acid dehydrogenase subunit E2 [Candidatus Heimdallarchaeota archaeon]
MPRRPDAELVKTSKFHELEFYIMRKKLDSTIFSKTQIDLTHTRAFLEEYNKGRAEEDKLTLFQIYLAACVRTVAKRYKINRFVSGRRLWQRNQIILSFVVKKEKTEDGEEVNAMIEFDPYDTLETVQKTVSYHLYESRYGVNKNEQDVKFWGSMPRWSIRFIFWLMRWTDEHNFPIYSFTKDIPMWSTAFLAHLGSIDVAAVYHHLFELGTTGVLITFGKMHKAPLINEETDNIEVKNVMNLRISIDDRIASGSYTGPTIDMLKDLIENPEPLVEPPTLTDKQLDKLMLKKYKKERLEREKRKRKEKKKK